MKIQENLPPVNQKIYLRKYFSSTRPLNLFRRSTQHVPKQSFLVQKTRVALGYNTFYIYISAHMVYVQTHTSSTFKTNKTNTITTEISGCVKILQVFPQQNSQESPTESTETASQHKFVPRASGNYYKLSVPSPCPAELL